MRRKAYGYCRVSGKGQLKQGGFDRQVKAVKAYARKHGFTIVEVFEERGVSGTVDETERPAFAKMVGEILADGVSVVLVESLDRLAREYRVQESLLVYLASKGVDLISCDTGENITKAIQEDPMKRALVQVQSTFSELEKNRLVLKLRASRERVRQEEGKCEGVKPYGTFDGEKEIVKRICALRRRPVDGTRRKSFATIAKILNQEGYRNRSGGEFTAPRVRQIFANRR